MFEVYADGEGCLKLATTFVIRDGEKVIIDAVAPLVDDHNGKNSGENPVPKHRYPADSISGFRSKTIHHRHRNFHNRKHRNGSKASTSFSSYHGPGLTRPSAKAADLDEVLRQGTGSTRLTLIVRMVARI